jgi:hypothetical protein
LVDDSEATVQLGKQMHKARLAAVRRAKAERAEEAERQELLAQLEAEQRDEGLL